MSLFDAMGIASTALTAQSIRLNTIASNMANANTVASSEEDAYKAKAPVFNAVLDTELEFAEDAMLGPGDYVELIHDGYDADAMAAQSGTIGYDILTGLGLRATPHYDGDIMNRIHF